MTMDTDGYPILNLRWSTPGRFYWQQIVDPGLLSETNMTAPLVALFDFLAPNPPKLTADSLAVARKTQFREAIARAHRKEA